MLDIKSVDEFYKKITKRNVPMTEIRNRNNFYAAT